MRPSRSAEVRSECQNLAALRQDFTIGQVAHLTGVNAKAIRYYESVGLLPRPPRTSNRYRCYTVADVNRLILLRRIRLLGVPLSSARSLLVGTSDAQCSDVQQELLALVDERLMTLEQQIADLQAFRTTLKSYRRTLAACRADENTSFSACRDMRCIDFPGEINSQEEDDEKYCTP